MAGAFLQWRARKTTAMLGQKWGSYGGSALRAVKAKEKQMKQARGGLMSRPTAPGCLRRVAARAEVRRWVVNTRRSLSDGCQLLYLTFRQWEPLDSVTSTS